MDIVDGSIRMSLFKRDILISSDSFFLGMSFGILLVLAITSEGWAKE